MPRSYYIDTARGGVFIRGWGVLTDHEVTTVGRAMREDHRFRPPPRRAFVVGSDVGYGMIRMLEP